MTEWKPEKNISSPWDVDAMEYNIGEPVKYEYIVSSSPNLYIHNPKLSNWTCYLFGGSPGNGIQWTPNEGKVPNAWYRFWMKVFFDCKWVRN